MKKNILLIVVLTTLLVSCKKDNSLKQQYQDLNNKINKELRNAVSDAEKDSLVVVLKEHTFDMLMHHIGEEFSDSIFLDTFYLFDDEELDALFGAMSEEMKNSEEIKTYYRAFCARQETAKGCKYKDIMGLDLQNEPFALSSIIGQTEYVLVDFWASWCRPCRELLPKLKAIYTEQPAGKLAILGVSCDNDTNAWKQAVESEQLTWKQIRSTADEPYNAPDIYGVVFIPTTILIDAEGTIIARNPSEEEIKDLLQ